MALRHICAAAAGPTHRREHQQHTHDLQTSGDRGPDHGQNNSTDANASGTSFACANSGMQAREQQRPRDQSHSRELQGAVG